MSDPKMLEWEAEPGKPLTGHEDKLKLCKYHGYILYPNSSPLKFYAADFRRDLDLVELHGALLDTSERFNGTPIKRRLTWYQTVTLINVGVILLPFDGGAK